MTSRDIVWTKVRQHFDGRHIEDVYAQTRAAVEQSGAKFRAGERVAVTVGSRGIANLPDIVRATVDEIRAQGARPFIIPAMGSHGGGTAEGQRAVLAGYGITAQSMGVEVVSSMDVVKIGEMEGPFRVYMARDAYEADCVVALNRVKPHTDFHGPVESGLMKMLVIGLGKHAQALETHRYGVYGLRELMPLAARCALDTGKIRMGVGVVENAYDQTLAVKACPGADIPALDGELLDLARRNMPSLPMDQLDLLVVEKMGKDISGTGMDTNVIGRIRIDGQPEPERPHIKVVAALSLTGASHGNATGMGLADIVTQRFKDDIDFDASYENMVTSSFIRRANLPLVARDEDQAIDWALRAIGPRTPRTLMAARIESTLKVDELWVSQAALEALKRDAVWQARRMRAL